MPDARMQKYLTPQATTAPFARRHDTQPYTTQQPKNVTKA